MPKLKPGAALEAVTVDVPNGVDVGPPKAGVDVREEAVPNGLVDAVAV